MQIRVAIRLCLVLMIGLFATSCSRWHKVSTDTPWIAGGKQASEFQRRKSSLLEVAIGPATYYETIWKSGDKTFDPYAIARATDEFLRSTPYGLSITGNQKPPPWGTIVSIEPTIALLVPSDSVKAKKGWLLGTNHPVRSIGPWKHGPGFNYGSVVMYNDGMRWFSPDLRHEPELVAFSTNGVARINFPGGSLELFVLGEICRVTRK